MLGTELGVGKRLEVDQAMQGIPYWALISTNSSRNIAERWD